MSKLCLSRYLGSHPEDKLILSAKKEEAASLEENEPGCSIKDGSLVDIKSKPAIDLIMNKCVPKADVGFGNSFHLR